MIESSEPVIVACVAQWCAEIAGVLAQAVGAKRGVKLACMDVEKSPDFAAQLRIENLPTTFLFHNGKALEKVVGTLTPQALTSLVNKAAALAGKQEPSSNELLTEANKLLTEGKVEDALQVYMALLQKSKEHHGASAYAGMALCALAVQGDCLSTILRISMIFFLHLQKIICSCVIGRTLHIILGLCKPSRTVVASEK